MTKLRWLAGITGCGATIGAGILGLSAFYIAILLILGAITGHWPRIGRGFMWAGALLVSVFILPYFVALQFAAGSIDRTVVVLRVMSAAVALLIIWFDILMITDAVGRMRIRNSPLNASK